LQQCLRQAASVLALVPGVMRRTFPDLLASHGLPIHSLIMYQNPSLGVPYFDPTGRLALENLGMSPSTSIEEESTLAGKDAKLEGEHHLRYIQPLKELSLSTMGLAAVTYGRGNIWKPSLSVYSGVSTSLTELCCVPEYTM
jgi:hypothetical protein